jgi:hypothetical protein
MPFLVSVGYPVRAQQCELDRVVNLWLSCADPGASRNNLLRHSREGCRGPKRHLPHSPLPPSWAKRILHIMRLRLSLLFLAPCVIAANQPTFTYAIPTNTTVAAMAVDAAGNTYLTGSTTSSSLPATAGALQTQFSGGTCDVLAAFHGGQLIFPCTDAFVIKLDPAGNVLFATYFGGNGNQTVASAICVDASGNVYLGGTTSPNTFSQPDTFSVTAGAAYTDSSAGEAGDFRHPACHGYGD